MIDADTAELRKLQVSLPPEADLMAGIATAKRLAEEWQVPVDEILPGATNCLVLASESLVLRVPLCGEESGPGYEAQLAFSGNGGVEILKDDPSSGSTLMPRLRPGTMLHEAGLTDAGAVRACCSVTRQFAAAATGKSMRVEDWYGPFLAVKNEQGIPQELLEGAQALAIEMLNSTEDRRLLHGDLHHFNLLKNGNAWVAIDPKGLVADPALEPAAFLRNPVSIVDRDDLTDLMTMSIRIFADELGLSAYRVWAWGVAQNTLSAWWDRGEARIRGIRIVEAIYNARP